MQQLPAGWRRCKTIDGRG